MVRVQVEQGYRFYFYSGEANQPAHIHIRSKSGRMKVWLSPLTIAECQGLPPEEQSKLLDLVASKQELFLKNWEGKANSEKEVLVAKPAPAIVNLQGDSNVLAVTLADGRSVVVPLAWFPRLRKASLEQLKNFELAWDGQDVTWPELDEDIRVQTFIEGLAGSCC